MKKIVDILSSKTYALVMTGLVMIAPIAYAEMEIPGSFATSSLPTLVASSTGILPFAVEFPEPIYEAEEKVRKGKVVRIYENDGYFVALSGDKEISVYQNATTTFYTGDGEPMRLEDLSKDMRVYIFGHIRVDGQEVIATKVVVANKNKFFTLRR